MNNKDNIDNTNMENMYEFLNSIQLSSKNIIDIYKNMEEKDLRLEKLLDLFFKNLKKEYINKLSFRVELLNALLEQLDLSSLDNYDILIDLLDKNTVNKLVEDLAGIETIKDLYENSNKSFRDFLIIQLKNCGIKYSILKEDEGLYQFFIKINTRIIVFSEEELMKIRNNEVNKKTNIFSFFKRKER